MFSVKCLNSCSHLISADLFPTAEEQPHRTKRDTASPPPVNSRNVHFVQPGVAFYLSCPIHSYHAVYTWEHGDKNSSCLQMQSNCLHLIPVMTQESYGNYKCISREKDYTKVVKQYDLVQREIQDTNPEKNASPAILGQTLRGLLLALTVILCCVETWLFFSQMLQLLLRAFRVHWLSKLTASIQRWGTGSAKPWTSITHPIRNKASLKTPGTRTGCAQKRGWGCCLHPLHSTPVPQALREVHC